MPRAKVPMSIGRGLERATGLAAVQPSSPVDVRNVYAKDAKMAVRPGMEGSGYAALEWGTDTLAIVPVKATLDLLFVLYDRTSKYIKVYRLDPENNVIQFIATWGVLSASDFPVVSYAEADGCVFLAHDEAEFSTRLPTVYYTPDYVDPALPGTLTQLTADLDDDGISGVVYFRGVTAHLEYMCGWGYGSETDANRPDIFRMSQPADPLTWKSENYAICGVKRDPILACVECAGMAPMIGTGIVTPSILAIAKSDETYRLIGTSPDDFGIELLDARFGVVSSRCLINIGGVAYGWSSDGPRIFTPTGTKSLSQPLELSSPLPVDFPDLGPERLCFTAYDQDARILYWVWPDPETGTFPIPAFLLSLWDPEDPRWTFATFEQLVVSAGRQVLRDLGGPATPPDGYISDIIAGDVG